ncbi:hypothetical protein [Kordia sp.]|uniref:hypothetical protein n=1 Tax=Kordia sp. TaxID=1965332 RepID=UPI003D2A9C05
MGKKKQKAVIEEKKENGETENKIKKQKYFEKESTFISITVVLFLIDLFSITALSIFFSDIIIGNNTSHLGIFSTSAFGIFVMILVLGIINGLVLIYITVLLKRFLKKK